MNVQTQSPFPSVELMAHGGSLPVPAVREYWEVTVIYDGALDHAEEFEAEAAAREAYHGVLNEYRQHIAANKTPEYGCEITLHQCWYDSQYEDTHSELVDIERLVD